MHRWFQHNCGPSQDGLYHIHTIQAANGHVADAIPEFIDQLADQIIGYATHSNVTVAQVFESRYRVDVTAAGLFRREMDRLLDFDNGLYRPLMGFAGECLAHWAAVSFSLPLAITTPKPFSQDPAFDLVGITAIEPGLQVNCIQAKTSAGYSPHECKAAVERYDSLYKGAYDYQLGTELFSLASNPDVQQQLAGRDWRVVLMDPNLRGYEIFACYSGNPPYPGLANWSSKVPGPSKCRGLVELRASDFRGFMFCLAEVIRGKVE